MCFITLLFSYFPPFSLPFFKSSLKFFPVFHFGQKMSPPPGGWPEYISLKEKNRHYLTRDGQETSQQMGIQFKNLHRKNSFLWTMAIYRWTRKAILYFYILIENLRKKNYVPPCTYLNELLARTRGYSKGMNLAHPIAL